MYKIIFPEYYEHSNFIQFETEKKGYLYGVKLKTEKATYELVFFDYIRLQQDSEIETKKNLYFYEPNLIIVEHVTKESIEKAIKKIYENNDIKYFLSD